MKNTCTRHFCAFVWITAAEAETELELATTSITSIRTAFWKSTVNIGSCPEKKTQQSDFQCKPLNGKSSTCVQLLPQKLKQKPNKIQEQTSTCYISRQNFSQVGQLLCPLLAQSMTAIPTWQSVLFGGFTSCYVILDFSCSFEILLHMYGWERKEERLHRSFRCFIFTAVHTVFWGVWH